MPLFKDRVFETTATTGTGTITLGGAKNANFRTFTSAFTSGDVVWYTIVSTAGWECGYGTFTSAGTTLTRTLKSSSTGSLISLTGTSDVFCSEQTAALPILSTAGDIIQNSAAGISDYNYYRITNPGGATYVTGSASVTGAIQVTLPVGVTNTMVRMTVKIYEYTTNESFEVHCGGYNYTGGTWANSPFAYIIGNPGIDRNFNVTFGYTAGGKFCIYIGNVGTVWSYPQVFVTEMQCGYSGYSVSFASGWSISFQATAFENQTAQITNCQIGQLATATPSANATAGAVGTSSLVARSDHVHPLNLTGHITSSGQTASLGSFTIAQLSAAISDADISGTNTGDNTIATGLTGTPSITVNTVSQSSGGGTTAHGITGTYARGLDSQISYATGAVYAVIGAASGAATTNYGLYGGASGAGTNYGLWIESGITYIKSTSVQFPTASTTQWVGSPFSFRKINASSVMDFRNSGGTVELSLNADGSTTIGAGLTVTGVATYNEAILLNTVGTPGAGRIYKSAVNGTTVYCVAGSSYDWVLANGSGSTIMSVATGTVNTTFQGTVNSVGNLSENGNRVYSSANPPPATAPSWSTITGNTTATSGTNYMCNTTSSAFTLTLPATPSATNIVRLADYAGTFSTYNLTVGRNSSKIMGLAEDMIISTNNVSITLTYIDATEGWVLT